MYNRLPANPFDDNVLQRNKTKESPILNYNGPHDNHILSRQDLENNDNINVTVSVSKSILSQGEEALITISSTSAFPPRFKVSLIEANDTNYTMFDQDNIYAASYYVHNECPNVTNVSVPFLVPVPPGHYKLAVHTLYNYEIMGLSNSFEVSPLNLTVVVPNEVYRGDAVFLQINNVSEAAFESLQCRLKRLSDGSYSECGYVHWPTYQWEVNTYINPGLYSLELNFSYYKNSFISTDLLIAISNTFVVKDYETMLSIQVSNASIMQGLSTNALVINGLGTPFGAITYMIVNASVSEDYSEKYIRIDNFRGETANQELQIIWNLPPGEFKIVMIDFSRTVLAISTTITVQEYSSIGQNISIDVTNRVFQDELMIIRFNIGDLYFHHSFDYAIFPDTESNYSAGIYNRRDANNVPSTFYKSNLGVVSKKASLGVGKYKVVLFLRLYTYGGYPYNDAPYSKLITVGESNTFVVYNNLPTKQPTIPSPTPPTSPVSIAPTVYINQNKEPVTITVSQTKMYQGQFVDVVINTISGAPLGYSNLYFIPTNDTQIEYTTESPTAAYIRGGKSFEITQLYAMVPPGSYKVAMIRRNYIGCKIYDVFGVSNSFEIIGHPLNVTTIVTSNPVYQDEIFNCNLSCKRNRSQITK
jgi:hypothetical protein